MWILKKLHVELVSIFCIFTSKCLILPFQKRQHQSNSKSRSEKFNPHPEEVASGFPIDPPRPSQAAEASINPQGPPHNRASHSGPLANRAAWAKEVKKLDNKISSGTHKVSSGVLTGMDLPSDDRKERSITLQREVPKLIGRFPGSFKETSELLIKDQRHPMQGGFHFHNKEEGKTSNKDPILVSSPTSALASCSCLSSKIIGQLFSLSLLFFFFVPYISRTF